MPYAEDAGRLIALAMRLEADTLVALGLGDAPAVEEARRDLETVFAGLAHRGLAYPLHTLAARFGLDGGAYAALTVALMPYHAPERVLALSASVGRAGVASPTLDLVLALLGPDPPTRARAEAALREGPLFTQALVHEAPDGTLAPSLAVLELLGLPLTPPASSSPPGAPSVPPR